MPIIAKKSALDKIEEMKTANNEYYKQLMYVKYLISYPWNSSDDDALFTELNKNMDKSRCFLDNLKKNMDSIIYGHNNCKNKIQELVAKWISNPSSSGTSIGLEGPPGVGKTLLAKGLGKSLDIPCVQISLGGQNDGEILIGHGYTYSGAQPGLIVKKMIEAGSSRCIMYFDELDKACDKFNNNEIFNILIHITDYNTNSEFQDRFFQEVNFPLNKVIFVFSYNDRSLIDPVLLDRLTKINVNPYSINDKINIATKFLIKEVCESMGFEDKCVKITEDNIKFIVEEYTNEAGVRELKRKIETILMKLNLDRIYKKKQFKKRKYKLSNKHPIKITRNTIVEYLEKPINNEEKIHNEDAVGIVNGLYATSSGNGGIVPIQIINNRTGNDNKFNFVLTGHMGKVMKESIRVACSLALDYVSEKNIKKFLDNNNYGFHVHAPNGATPKDGPSAGSAFATAFISRILNKKIKRDVGMTGEIDLLANITKIGGLIYKITGARKAGIKKVLVSIENKDDIEDIKKNHGELLKGDFEIKYVSVLSDILKEVIIGLEDDDIKKSYTDLNNSNNNIDIEFID